MIVVYIMRMISKSSPACSIVTSGFIKGSCPDAEEENHLVGNINVEDKIIRNCVCKATA